MKTKGQLLAELIDRAKLLGLGNQDLISAKEYLEYNEYGLCFDLIITQLYEFNIEIDKAFYSIISEIAKELDLSEESYSFMEELIRV